MRADFALVLDASVLANHPVADLLLRLAEKPRLHLRRWSPQILEETLRTHLSRLRWPESIASSFQEPIQSAFPEAMVHGLEPLIEACGNDLRDRQVLACAIHSNTELILTYNLADFPPSALQPWAIRAEHPQDYLLMLHELEPSRVLHQLLLIAHRRCLPLEDHLIELGRHLPRLAGRLLESLELEKILHQGAVGVRIAVSAAVALGPETSRNSNRKEPGQRWGTRDGRGLRGLPAALVPQGSPCPA
jgi:predicted nucleic acid-binding protein